MTTPLVELAKLVDGRIVGNGELAIRGAAALDQATTGDITLLDSIERLTQCRATAAVVPASEEELGGATRPGSACAVALVVVDDVHSAFTTIFLHFHPRRPAKRIGVHSLAVVDPSAQLADDVDVHPGATIGPDVRIGKGTTIHSGTHIMAGCEIGPGVTLMPGVTLYDETLIGDRTTIHAGAVIGGYGFGYQMVEGRHDRQAQLGNVVIGADVEIGAGTTIDRGTYGPTTIGDGTKIDNLVMIAHNCRIGRHNLICSQVGIAGSTTTGDYVVMAGQVGVRDHVQIGSGAVLGAMAGVSNDVPAGARVFGIPATPEREQKLKQAALAKLPEMRREFRALRHSVEELIEQNAASEHQQHTVRQDDSDGQAA